MQAQQSVMKSKQASSSGRATNQKRPKPTRFHLEREQVASIPVVGHDLSVDHVRRHPVHYAVLTGEVGPDEAIAEHNQGGGCKEPLKFSSHR